ncbi:bifunctional phosphatase PAP2/diacylglycerol kinase family protein [Actinomadura rupiterrae]|uniref:bifunctional phosphatase PAP2/diacylglycerol kinase family protein n=1 Tax=Actinomadura rupiterrae TaxID=559627 RepID=UPI0020A48910|nr:bifunctional phosphatase PAP2/diacylglycerol kinase family protein [Actinomadura rupiterrae]MCP2337054.1 undecaprenyl-diphosphatase [Actinomadura rupiterrae]
MRATHRTSPSLPLSVTDGGPRAGRGPLARLGRLDRDAFERVAEARLPGLEYVLPRLSRAADHGLLWFGTAAALGASGRPRLRRAALRGLIGIAVASPVVNLLGKQAFRRRRPVVDLVPPVRIRWKLPTSHAFPSGHSASAAAFATGVAMEAPPAVAVPIAGVAAAVCFSRVYTGAHYPGDVLAGAAVGAAAALGTRLVWPARPAVAKVSHTTTEQVVVQGDGRGVVAVINMGSGANHRDDSRLPSRAESVARILERELPDAEIVRFEPGGDLAAVLDAAASRAEALAVVGGDGTVNAAARAALAHKVPLLAVPGGTFDHFVRALGIETVTDAVAAYRGGRLGRVDVGRIAPGDAVFLNTASFGAYTDLVALRERLQGRLGKWPATAVAAIRTLRDFEPREMIIDGRPRKVWLAFVGNGVYGSRGPAPTWRTDLDDGLFDVRIVHIGRRVPRLRALASVLGGGLHVAPGFKAWQGGSLDITDRSGGFRLAYDGEVTDLPSTVRFTIDPRALQVFVPRKPH